MPVTGAGSVPLTGEGLADGGGGGGATGVTAFDAPEGGLVPPPLAAVTLNVYDVPLVRPETTAEVAPRPAVAWNAPGVDVTVYAVGTPPVPGVQVTVALALPAVAAPMTGAPGAVGARTVRVKGAGLVSTTPLTVADGTTVKVPGMPLAVSSADVARPVPSVLETVVVPPGKVPLEPVTPGTTV